MTDEKSEVYVQYIYIYTFFSLFCAKKITDRTMDFKKRGKKHHETIYIYTHNLDIFIKKMQLVTRGKKTQNHIYIYIHIYTRNLNFMAKI